MELITVVMKLEDFGGCFSGMAEQTSARCKASWRREKFASFSAVAAVTARLCPSNWPSSICMCLFNSCRAFPCHTKSGLKMLICRIRRGVVRREAFWMKAAKEFSISLLTRSAKVCVLLIILCIGVRGVQTHGKFVRLVGTTEWPFETQACSVYKEDSRCQDWWHKAWIPDHYNHLTAAGSPEPGQRTSAAAWPVPLPAQTSPVSTRQCAGAAQQTLPAHLFQGLAERHHVSRHPPINKKVWLWCAPRPWSIGAVWILNCTLGPAGKKHLQGMRKG